MELSSSLTVDQEALVSHANAALTSIQCARIGRFVVEGSWSFAYAAIYFHVSWRTAKRWSDRYAAMGRAGPGCRMVRKVVR